MPRNGANPPSERPDGKKKRDGICLALQPAEADLLRQVSEQTKLTQTELRKHLEGSAVVSKAIRQALRERYTTWRNDQLGKDLFAGLDREKEGAGA